MFTHAIFLGLSLLLTLLFFLYGFNHYYLLYTSRRYRPPSLPPLDGDPPHIAIHLPIYNEKYVVRRLADACARMAEAYGPQRVRIVLVDDSDDDTRAEVELICREYRQAGLCIEVLRRQGRQGYKAGALQAALDGAGEEFIAIFDADFIPPADFLNRSLPYFAHDPGLGVIQTRWTHLNRDYNLVTRAVAIGIDVHFFIDQPGRYAAGCYQNFNGSGGVFRLSALRQAGGWQADTLAEDLDVSYRVQLQGYRILYLQDLPSPGEVPLTVPSYKKQQARWANGSLRTARKILPTLLTQQGLGFKKRLEALIHLTAYLVHPMMFISFLLACLATLFRVDTFRIAQLALQNTMEVSSRAAPASPLAVLQNLTWLMVFLLILLCTVAAWITPVVALRSQKLPIRRNLFSLVTLFLLGCGVSLSNTIEAGKALFTRRSYAFKRTPKYAVQTRGEGWRDKKYQVPLDFVSLLELAVMGLGLTAIGYAIWRENFAVLVILIPYTAAYSFVGVLTLLQSRQGAGA